MSVTFVRGDPCSGGPGPDLVWTSRDLPGTPLTAPATDGPHSTIADPPRTEVTQLQVVPMSSEKLFWVNVSTGLDFHFTTEIDVQKTRAQLHTIWSHWSLYDLNIIRSSPLDLQQKRDKGGKKSICCSLCGVAAPNSLLSHLTIQILSMKQKPYA